MPLKSNVSSQKSMTHTIRRATEQDAAALIELRRLLFSKTSSMLWEPAEFTQTAEDERKRIERLHSRSNGLVLVAEVEGKVVGLLTAVGGELNRLRHSALFALGVARAHWGKGVATSLVREGVLWANAVGLKRVELTVHTTNLRAISVYLRCGFEIEGLRRSSLLVDGAFVDEYLMSIVRAG